MSKVSCWLPVLFNYIEIYCKQVYLIFLYLEGVEVVDKVKDRRSSDKISKLCERRPESTIEFSHPISGDEALELEDVFGVVDL